MYGADMFTYLFLKCQPHVVVNCAAISVPRSCEMDPAAAMSINVPSSLVKWLLSFEESNTLLIHLSTDQGKPCQTQFLYLVRVAYKC